jgi:hypothetical protein
MFFYEIKYNSCVFEKKVLPLRAFEEILIISNRKILN